jgi:hypothetical protein
VVGILRPPYPRLSRRCYDLVECCVVEPAGDRESNPQCRNLPTGDRSVALRGSPEHPLQPLEGGRVRCFWRRRQPTTSPTSLSSCYRRVMVVTIRD